MFFAIFSIKYYKQLREYYFKVFLYFFNNLLKILVVISQELCYINDCDWAFLCILTNVFLGGIEFDFR